MLKSASQKAQPGERAKSSLAEIAVLLVLCPLAGIGTGLAFESDTIGFAVAAFGLIAVAAYATAAHLGRRPHDRREASRRLSVTEIATGRRGAPAPVAQGRAPAPDADKSDAVRVAEVAKAADSDRVVPFRIQSIP